VPGREFLRGSVISGIFSAFSEMMQTDISLLSHPFRRKTRKGWGTEVYSKCENALARTGPGPPPRRGSGKEQPAGDGLFAKYGKPRHFLFCDLSMV
jgi:hypothetical protein